MASPVPVPVVPPTGLPVEEVVAAVASALDGHGAAVLEAEPGAGKTTVVPLRLFEAAGWLDDRRIVMLEPRRVAARAAATRMADLLGEDVGDTVGVTTRDDRRVGPKTRIEVVTDGVLVRRLQHDPSLPDVGLIIFDELHERHLQTDLALALTLDVRRSLREDLRVLAMSATIDTGPVSALLGGAPVVTSAGRTFPVEVRWSDVGRGVSLAGMGRRLATGVAAAITSALSVDDGDVLVFLPGVGEIHGVSAALGRLGAVEVLPLHGSLSAAEQDRALRAGPRRRVVLATDVAESSVTVEGVGVVVDAGLARRPAYDPATGLSRLRTVVTSRASADQRAGRAGRLRPGVAYRLWPVTEHPGRRAWPDPEIVTVDLADVALELAVWGADADELSWLDPPPGAAMASATTLLEELGALADGRPTPMGRRMAGIPLHPRLARMLLADRAGRRRTAARLAALLSERDIVRRDRDGWSATADVAERLAVLDRTAGDPAAGDAAVGDAAVGDAAAGDAAVDQAAVATVRRRAAQLARLAPRDGGRVSSGDVGAVLADAYPDRLAQSRGGGRFRLRHGGAGVLPSHDPLAGADWLVAAEVTAGTGVDGRIRLAAAIDRADVRRIGADRVHTELRLVWDDTADDLRAVTETTLDALVLERTVGLPSAGPATSAALVDRAVTRRLVDLGWTAGARALQARADWAHRHLDSDWPDVSDAALAASAADWLTPLLSGATGQRHLARVDPRNAIAGMLGGRRHELDRLVPATLALPTGRSTPIDYTEDGPRASVRVQELYGTTDHPTIGRARTPVTIELLSPAGRPIQITSDLPGFWAGSWREVRREMAYRYPKHVWPDDPAHAPPTTGAKRRRAP